MRHSRFQEVFWRLAIVFHTLLFGTGALAQQSCLGDQASKQVYSVYIVPQSLTATTFGRWSTFLERLGRAAGQCYDLRLSATIPDFERALLNGQADFAFANPYHEVMAKSKQGYLPLIRDEKTSLSGVVVVKKDSDIHELNDLGGKPVAFPAPNSFAASLLIRAKFAQQGIKIVPKYVKTHANVFRAVANGDAAAGGGVNITLDEEEPALKEQLRILDKTLNFAPHPFIAHPRVGKADREKLIEQFIAMAKDVEGRHLLDEINVPSPVRSNYEKDYAPLEKLHLDKFVVAE